MGAKKGRKPKPIGAKGSDSSHRGRSFQVIDRRLVLVDDTLLRKRAASECAKAMAKLEKARAELKRFEEEESPAFAQWMASTFGPVLTQVRENARLISEKEQLVQEVEMERYCACCSGRTAYASVMERRAKANQEEYSQFERNGESSGEADFVDPSDDFDPFEGDVSEAESEMLFEEFLITTFGIRPEELSHAEYERIFAEFQQQVLGRMPGDNPRGTSGSKAQRIKEIYRTLVRRLHPDLRADGDLQVSAIWHEVQEAYETGNLERMETLLALTEIQTGLNGGKASVSHMRAAAAELRRALQAIQQSLREARLAPAWGFSKIKDVSLLKHRIRKELEQELARQHHHLNQLEQIIEKWTRPKKPGKKSAGRSSPRSESDRKARSSPSIQAELFPGPV